MITSAIEVSRDKRLKDMLIIFDLDGTLLNTIDDLGAACNYALERSGFPKHQMEEYPSLVGNGINALIRRSLPSEERIEENVLKVREYFVPYYNEHNCDLTKPYKGIEEVLKELKQKGCALAVASNKYQVATEKIVERFFPGIFDIVLGEREGHPRKPDPEIVYTIIEEVRKTHIVNEVLYVGDSLVDVETAQNAKVKMIACSWGFCKREQLEGKAPQIIDNAQELLVKKTAIKK